MDNLILHSLQTGQVLRHSHKSYTVSSVYVKLNTVNVRGQAHHWEDKQQHTPHFLLSLLGKHKDKTNYSSHVHLEITLCKMI